jgi:hypothetical protein
MFYLRSLLVQIYNHLHVYTIIFLRESKIFLEGAVAGRTGGSAERGYAGLATLRGRRLDFRGVEWLPFMLVQNSRIYGYAVQSNGMQERLAASPRRATAGLCIALHTID